MIQFAIAGTLPGQGNDRPPGRFVQSWCDPDGNLIATGREAGSKRWLDFPGLALFHFDLNSDNVIAHPSEFSQTTEIYDTFYRSVLPFVLQLRGYIVLHASAIVTDDGIIAFCAGSGTGKSTLASVFAGRGYSIWTDDTLIIDVDGMTVEVLANPFHVRVDKVRPPWIGRQGDSRQSPLVPDTLAPEDALRMKLQALYMLQRPEVIEPRPFPSEIQWMAKDDALKAIMSQAYVFSLNDKTLGRAFLEDALAIANTVPVGALQLPPEASLDGLVENLLNPDPQTDQ